MRVSSSGPATVPLAGAAQRPGAGPGAAAGGAFSLPAVAAATVPRSAAPGPASLGAVAPLASLAAMLVVQSLPDPTEWRRRAMRHGHALLDGLQELHLALIDGDLPPAVLQHLHAQLAQRPGDPDDGRLEAVLGEIELRVAVELAKLERAPA